MQGSQTPAPRPDDDFVRAAHERGGGLLVETWQFLSMNKKWWLAPIFLVMLLLGLLALAGSSAAAPFIYTLF